MSFQEWADDVARAYVQVPRTYQEAYKLFLDRYPQHDSLDKAAGFHGGWMAACDALANLVVAWLDDPQSGDQVVLDLVSQMRRGNLS